MNFSTTVYAQEDIHKCFSEQPESFDKLHGEGWLDAGAQAQGARQPVF